MGQPEAHAAEAKREHATATSANAEEQKLQNTYLKTTRMLDRLVKE
jgi:hypothetical protein